MKRGGLWAACVVVLISVAFLTTGQGVAQDVEGAGRARCSLATLRGMYLFAADGVGLEGDTHVPFAAAGYEVYHGNGKVNAVVSVNVNGELTRHVRTAGKYTVKADCTGTVSYPDLGEQFDVFIAPDGSMFTWISTVPEFVVAGVDLRGTSKRVGD